MKKRISYIPIAILTLSALTFSSCKKFLDVNKSPNSAESVDSKLLFASAEGQFGTYRASGDLYIPVGTGAQSFSDGGNNPNAWGAPQSGEYIFSIFSFGNIWQGYYNPVGSNLISAIELAESSTPKNNNAAAVCKVLLAEMYYELATLYGDVPFSEAIKSDIPFPKFDSQQDVMNGAIGLLDGAFTQFDEASSLKYTDYDLFYKGDIAKWKRVSKSLKLRILMTMVDKDPSKAAAIGQLVTAGGLINSAADNLKIAFQNVAGKKNPKYSLIEQYFGGVNPFFASNFVVDYMRPLNDPRLPRFFDKPAAADNYYGIMQGEDGDDNHDARISFNLITPDEAELFYSYQEELFFEAEVYARGLGVTANLATANTLYKKAIEESCKYYGVAAGTAATFAAGLANLTGVATPVKTIHYQHWIDKMDEPLEAFTEWRRSGPDGDETPALTLPTGAPAGPLFRRYEYPITNELALNPNAPPQIKFFVKTWFDL